MKYYLKVFLIITLALGSMIGAGFLWGKLDTRRRNAAPTRGSEYERSAVRSELVNMYNDPGERTVEVTGEGTRLVMIFHDDPMRAVRMSFYNRHKNDFKRFYEAGYDTLVVEAKKDGGAPGKIEYDLTRY